MRRLILRLAALAVAGFAVFWVLTAPEQIDPAELSGLTGDPARGELIFHAGGCASCHAAPKAEGDARLVLSGGRAFPSPFGTFYAPNISPSAAGIAGWSDEDLVNAMRYGVSPDGAHYFPAFPYGSYSRAELSDIVNLKAFMNDLPADATESKAHDVGFPFNIRRTLGGWKLLFMSDDPLLANAETEQLKRGRYLAEALGHCGECHTPRNALGGLQLDQWLGGAPNPGGKGRIPNITPGKLTWDEVDIIEYLTSGFTPEYDVVGGHMAEVVENLSKLPDSDRAAIAAYLKAVPAQP
jgi:mono/diheme cytochrome c family protein